MIEKYTVCMFLNSYSTASFVFAKNCHCKKTKQTISDAYGIKVMEKLLYLLYCVETYKYLVEELLLLNTVSCNLDTCYSFKWIQYCL